MLYNFFCMAIQNPFSEIEARLINIECLLHDIVNTKPQQPQTAVDELLTIEQAATLLHLSRPTIYRLVGDRAVPHSKRGKRLYFSRTELLTWAQSGRHKTVTEMAADANTFLSNKKRG